MKNKLTSKSGIFIPRVLLAFVLCAMGIWLAIVGLVAQTPQYPVQYLRRDAPADTTPYARPIIPEDLRPMGKAQPTIDLPTPTIFVRDTIVSNTNSGLATTDSFNDGEPSIAINPANPSQVAITAFSGSWGANTPIFYSTNGGAIWTKEFTVPQPPGAGNGTAGCPCDQDVDFQRGNLLAGTFLSLSPTDPYTGLTSDPTNSASWNWPLSGGNAVTTNRLNGGSAGNTDQPWLLTNRDTANAANDNVYTAYDDFSVNPVGMHVAVSLNANPPLSTRDQSTGTSGGPAIINPGHRMAVDPRNGWVYDLFQNSTAVDNSKATVTYSLNRSQDGGQTWTLNGSGTGIAVASGRGSTQGIGPQTTFVMGQCAGVQPNNLFKFGTVNALLGGVDHATVDPNNGDVYYVYGDRDNITGNNRLSIVRLTDNGANGLNIGTAHFVTGQVQAALPSVAVAINGVVGVLYTQFDGISGGFPSFSTHLATSSDQGVTFADVVLENFLSPSADNGNCRQRVLGDYDQMKAVGNIFYGVFTGNGVPFGRTTSNNDPIFFKASASPAVTLTTTASPTVVIGGSVSDSVNVGSGFNPTGSVTFSLYGPNDATCGNAPIFTDTKTVSGDGTYNSASFTPATAGTYRWIVTYSGDTNNFAGSGSCNDANESVVVSKATPTLSTLVSPNTHRVGAMVTDTATVSGGFSPTGTVTFRLFGPNDSTCSTAPVFTSTKTLSGGTATSDPFIPTLPGTYRWIASYNGDANNNAVVGLCNAANESVLFLPPATSLTGSGTINAPGGSASFIVNAQFKNGVSGRVTGNVDYSDPNAGFRLTQIKITSMVFTGDCVHITGTARIGNRTRVSFTVDACDNFPPGTDSFAISISNGYAASGNITSGQIVFHP